MHNDWTLLLVDDDETTRDLLSLTLGAEGWQVGTAADGETALQAVSGDKPLPSVILSDLQMPGLSGGPMAGAIRKSIEDRGVVPAPLLIAMTATRTSAPPEGFDDLLVKPFAPEELRQRCDALWSSDRSASHAPQRQAIETSKETTPVLSLETFEQLRASMPLGQLRALYDFALLDAGTRVIHMSEAAKGFDDARFRREAHALKGSCGMIGASRLRNLAGESEATGIQTGNTLMESNPLTEFNEEIRQIRLMLERLLQN
jgi:DNA-binding response OmpR family regulator